MNRIIRIIIPIILVAIFIGVMTTGSIVKKPMTQHDDVMYYIKLSETEIASEQWEQAAVHLSNAEKAWKKVVKRIQFSAERDEISTFHKALDRTKGFIQAQDKGGALAELAEANFIWSELGK